MAARQTHTMKAVRMVSTGGQHAVDMKRPLFDVLVQRIHSVRGIIIQIF